MYKTKWQLEREIGVTVFIRVLMFFYAGVGCCVSVSVSNIVVTVSGIRYSETIHIRGGPVNKDEIENRCKRREENGPARQTEQHSYKCFVKTIFPSSYLK
mmetsp:Transcript_48045/g.48904  ORF Transcript_48045/g.48904 Transcript_48045/m.48904 type:complete len:100 (-) Transcript_48045:40-339(-)